MNDAAVVLECRGLAKSFREGSARLEVLRDVNLQVGRAAQIAIIGSSGSGKSTLLHLLGGLDMPSAGSVWADGQELSGMSDAGRGRDLLDGAVGAAWPDPVDAPDGLPAGRGPLHPAAVDP